MRSRSDKSTSRRRKKPQAQALPDDDQRFHLCWRTTHGVSIRSLDTAGELLAALEQLKFERDRAIGAVRELA